VTPSGARPAEAETFPPFPGVELSLPLTVLEAGRPKRLSLGGALAYHADGRDVGVVVGYLMVKRLLEALPGPPERRSISLRSGHPGIGMEDAFEFLLRAVSERRYERVDFPDGPIVAGAPGSFRCDMTVADRAFQIRLRPDVLDPALFAKPDPSDPDDARRRRERQAAAIAALLAAPIEALFDLRDEPAEGD